MAILSIDRPIGLACLLMWTCAQPAAAQSPAVDFATEIQPILARNCYACHGPDQQEGSIRFDDRATLLGEADSGEQAIVPGDIDASELLRRVRATEDSGERMPPEGKPLSDEDIERLERWIADGAEFVAHWSFQPPERRPLPAVRDGAWARQPLDHFTLARLERAGLAPVAEAEPADLIRRVYLDVTGLPPSPETVRELTDQWSDATYELLVDRLLASPAFGDHWARMWLDVVRYAETNSFERDGAKPNAWRFRDYVIDAMNDDKPFDQFIREQLAGDELDEVTPESLIATGYYRLGLWDDEPADPLQAKFDEFDDLVTTTSQAFLGLTLNCARCHDHKIDPLSQRDYYAMVAFLRDVTPYGTRADQTSNNQIDLDPKIAQRYEAIAQRMEGTTKRVREIEREAIEKMPAPDQRATEGPERGKVLREKLSSYVDEATWQEYSRLKGELERLRKRQRELPPRETVLGLARLNARPATTHVMLRGSPHAEGEPVEPSFLELLGGGTPVIPEAPPEARSAGRRRVLADWIASDGNWMTPRVIVNRLWLQYFGRGIARSPNNFGLMGEPPTHPELLDHLALELVGADWHLKPIHRAILLSSTYRLGTRVDAEALARDPANDLFWRQNVRRLSAEQIRDGVLAVTGELNEQRHGPSMYPTLSAEVLASQSRPGLGWGKSAAADQARRSIYIHVKRSLPVPLLAVFDFPETDISCEARFMTVQPGQALTMLNGDWTREQASALLRRVRREVGDDAGAQARRCLELVACREPSAEDVAELVSLAERLEARHGWDAERARGAMCLVALNINPFYFID